MLDTIRSVRHPLAAVPVAGIVLAACSGGLPGPEPPGSEPQRPDAGFTVREAPIDFTEIDAVIAPAPDIEAMIAPYREQLEERLAQVVGHAAGDFVKDDPEGALENLVADALLDAVQDLANDTVHVVLLNDGGLRVPIAAGPILMRHAYELLPFENYVAVMSLTGGQLERLADEIALTRGEPIAGWTMELDGDDAVNVRVGGDPIDPARVYRLATVDFLANGGGNWPVLWEAGTRPREDLGVLIRDAFVAYLREQGTVTPTLDGRVRPADDARRPARTDDDPGTRRR